MLKALAFRFGQQEYCEENTEDAESSAYPEGRVVSVERGFQVVGELGDDEGPEPADGDRYTGSLSFNVRGEHLAHHGPRKRAPAHAVRDDEDDERDHRQPGYLSYHFVRVLYFLQVEIQAQGALQNKCPVTRQARNKRPGAKVKICVRKNILMFGAGKILIIVIKIF